VGLDLSLERTWNDASVRGEGVVERRLGVATGEVPAPAGPYSQGIIAGDFLFVAGQGPFTCDGSRAQTIEEQIRQALANLDAVARAAGGSLRQAVRVGVYLSSMVHFAEMNQIYEEFFTLPRPARTTVAVALVGFDVEIDAIVWLGG